MAAQNFHNIERLVDDNCGCVVVSAIGKEFPGDVKTTDLLKAHFLGDLTAWTQIEQKYKRLVEVNGINVDVEKVLFEAKLRSKKYNLAYCLSLGEEMSAKITAAFFKCGYVEAEECVRFKNGRLCSQATLKNLKSAFSGVNLGVIGGFYGGSENGRQVFSRGGSDVTGSLCAVATASSVYRNWTDVCGVCKANPKQISGVSTIANLSYAEMYLLAKGGAEVLHPDSVKIAEQRAIPVVVGNFLNEFAPCTVVSNCPSHERFLGVTEKNTPKGIVATVLHGMSNTRLCSYLTQFFEDLENVQQIGSVRVTNSRVTVFSCKLTENCVEICTSQSVLPPLYRVFSQAESG